jgi:hypothetical protein
MPSRKVRPTQRSRLARPSRNWHPGALEHHTEEDHQVAVPPDQLEQVAKNHYAAARVFMARLTSTARISSESSARTIIRAFARRLRNAVSVGLKAVLVLREALPRVPARRPSDRESTRPRSRRRERRRPVERRPQAIEGDRHNWAGHRNGDRPLFHEPASSDPHAYAPSIIGLSQTCTTFLTEPSMRLSVGNANLAYRRPGTMQTCLDLADAVLYLWVAIFSRDSALRRIRSVIV